MSLPSSSTQQQQQQQQQPPPDASQPLDPQLYELKRFGKSIKYLDFSHNSNLIKKGILYGLLIGDCLGSTSEFKHPKLEVPLLVSHNAKGEWPFQLQGNRIWKKGESTDDGDVCF